MRRVMHYLKGNTRIEIESPYPERFMNACAQNGIGFWDLERVDAITIRVTLSLGGYQQLSGILSNLNVTVTEVKREGAPVFWRRIRKRYALLIGGLIAVAAVFALNLHVWDIEIEGNDTVPRIEIIEALESVGFGIGSFGFGIDQTLLRNAVLLHLEDVAWITVNVNGSRATVLVRERIHAPPRIDEGIPTMVYATQGGVVDEMVVWEGHALVAVGDTIEIGQDLVSGRMESLAQQAEFVRADARIYVRTWYDLGMTMPLYYARKEFTGREQSNRRIFFGNNGINLFFDSGISYARYDKIISEHQFSLPFGVLLPIRLERRLYREYEPLPKRVQETDAALLVQARLLEELETMIGTGGEVLRTEFEVLVEEWQVTVHLRAEVREQVAALRRMQADEMQIQPQIEEAEQA